MGFFSKLFGGDSILKNAEKLAGKAEALKAKFDAMSDAELRAKTDEHRKRAASGESLDDLLPEVFAQVRAASKRVLGMEHYHVQLVGGAVLHLGNIAEMKTGEGKTLVATLPACLNALTGSVHIVTVNDYLATRDSEWMGKLYKFLGYSVGLIVKDMEPAAKQAAYACDIIYATNNELGFDYLRDNMVIRRESMVQSTLNYAIIDEVDSILIDEARTPLIISGRGEKSTEAYQLADRFARRLKLDQDFSMDEKKKTINLTEKGVQAAEAHFGVENWADASNTEMSHHVNQALRAHYLMHRDVDYVVQNGEVVIVDEFTGRIMTGRRYSNGLHQAIEAKEGVRVERESKTLATITFQNFFRMYKKISGMTGTAKTEEDEFSAIYALPVVQIPTNKPMIREDLNDVIYPTVRAKFIAVIDEIAEVHKTGRPILVGTVSVEHSEVLSKLLSKRGVPHEVLNAKHHEKEAQIIAQAGKLGAVTIATNMAGRGTDILLGGNPDYMAHTDMRREGYEEEHIYDAVSHAETDDPEVIALRQHYQELVEKHKKTTELEHKQVVAAGGLYIIGTERHESRRIDNQLRGRSGRQGDPGASKFYIALEDDLMRLFGGEKIKVMMERMKAGDDMPLEFGIMSKQIENAQKRIEERNFGIRKNVLEYDDVMNKQRTIIYDQRRRVLMGEDIHATVMDMTHDLIDELCDQFCPDNLYPEEWSIDILETAAHELFLPQDMQLFSGMDICKLSNEQAKAHLHELAESVYAEREKELTEAGVDMRDAERVVLLRNVDNNWMRHIDDMDQLKQGVGLRAYGQRDPLVEFRMESYDMFDEMVHGIKEGTVKMLYHLTIRSNIQVKPQAQSVSANEPQTKKPVKAGRKVGRNDPCPCGSGKKYKNCCGRN